MNLSEPETPRPEAPGLQIELGAKPARRFRAVWLVPLLIFLVAGSATLLAWLPRSSPAPLSIVSLSPSPEFQGTSSTVPPLTWSPGSTEVTLSPGDSTFRDITFTSSRNLTNVVIEPVPEIARFLTITPSTLNSVLANTPQSVRVTFAIAQGTTLGTYQGTIHLRIGTQTLPQTVKVTVDVWNTAFSSALGLSIKYPATWSSTKQPDGSLSIDSPQLVETDTAEDTHDIFIRSVPNSGHLSMSQFFDGTHGPNLYNGNPTIQLVSIADVTATHFSGLTPAEVDDVVVIPRSGSFLIITSTAPAALLSTLLTTVVLN